MQIYLDNAATTPVRKEVLDVMLPYYSEIYGNPSSAYFLGRSAHQAIEEAREKVAKVLGCVPEELFFTSGGTESDNWALKGTARMLKDSGKRHIISSTIEHHAILHTLDELASDGFEITKLPVDSSGVVKLNDLENSIRSDTALVSIMYANNEIGTIQNIKELTRIAHEHNVLFHTDAVQAIGAVDINVEDLGVDMLSLSAHKFNGPKGIGALYVKKGTRICPFINGGKQENGRRAGTENVASIVGLGKAIELAYSNLPQKNKQILDLRNYILERSKKIGRVFINGSENNRLPNNVNLTFECVEADQLLRVLDGKGICCSSGSACTTGLAEPSHVLKAIGLDTYKAQCTMRITLGYQNTFEDVRMLCDVLEEEVPKIRKNCLMWDE